MTNELVRQLAEGNHPIIASRIKSIEELRQSIERGYLLIKFTDTEGGTELGVKLDSKVTNLDGSDKANGTVHLTGFFDSQLHASSLHCRHRSHYSQR